MYGKTSGVSCRLYQSEEVTACNVWYCATVKFTCRLTPSAFAVSAFVHSLVFYWILESR